MIIVLLTRLVNCSIHTRFVSLDNQQWEIQPSLINLHPHVCNQDLHCHSVALNRYRCFGSFKALIDISYKVCATNKTDNLNIHIFTMIAGIKWIKNIYYANSNIKLIEKNVIQMKSGITINIGVVISVIKELYLESCYMYLQKS